MTIAKTAVAALMALALALSHSGARAADPGSVEGILDFAGSLMGEGESYRAATEYMRALHFSADPASRRASLEGLARAYARAGRYDDATGPLRTLAEEFGSPPYRARLGEALYRAGRNEEAALLLLSGEPPREEVRLGTLAWLKADTATAPPPGADAGLVREFGELPRKSPTVAGLLSAVLPGAGHLYVDRPHDAAVAFVLNALFIWGSAGAIERREWGLAAVLGSAELLWYSGTVVGSVNGAHKWNARERERFFQRNTPPSGLSLWGGQGAIGATVATSW